MQIDLHTGDRSHLRPLFALADDSPTLIDGYIDAGEILVARIGDEVVGHLQLVATETPGVLELKIMAVLESHQRGGIGRALVMAAIDRCRARGDHELVVATATAGVGQLRFYQRLGFRMTHVVRDVFVPANGYPEGLVDDGMPVRDQVWLQLVLAPASRPA